MNRRSQKPNKLILSMIFIILTSAIILFGHDGKMNQQKKYIGIPLSARKTAKIHKKNNPDVRVVWNDEKGIWDKNGNGKVELVHELTFGAKEDDPNKDFYRLACVAGDIDGNFYIHEFMEGYIRKYDNQGRYLLTFGRKGQGPGEYNGLALEIEFDDGNNLVVMDLGNNRINHVSSNGQLLYSFNLSRSASNPSGEFVWSDSGFFFISEYIRSTETIIHKYNYEGELIKSFGMPLQFNKPKTIADQSANQSIKSNNSRGSLAIVSDKLLYTQRNPYEIRIYSLEGVLKTVIYRKNKFMPPDKMEVTGNHTYKMSVPVKSILIGSWKGFIINCVGIPPNMDTDFGCIIDIFSSEGQLVQSIKLKEHIWFSYIDLKGKLYGQIASYDTYGKIVRYRLKLKNDTD